MGRSRRRAPPPPTSSDDEYSYATVGIDGTVSSTEVSTSAEETSFGSSSEPLPGERRRPRRKRKHKDVWSGQVRSSMSASYVVDEDLAKGPLGEHETRWRDVVFLLLFVVHLGCVVAIAVLQWDKTIVARDPDEMRDSEAAKWLDRDVLPIWIACIGVSLIWALLWVTLTRAFARVLIPVCMVGTVVVYVVVAGVLLAVGLFYYGLVVGVIALVTAVFFYLWRGRVPFSTAILVRIINLVFEYPATLCVSLLLLFVTVVWVVLWLVLITIPISEDLEGSYAAEALFLVFSLYWTTQVLKNIVHVTVSGTIATWYFRTPHGIPANPTMGSLRRACTYAIGSICFGSLVVAIIKTVRAVVRYIRQVSDGYVALCLDCLLSCIDWIVQYFNTYAFAQVAIYGKSYIESARDTWSLITTHGVSAIINDNLVGVVSFCGALVGGAISATLAAVWASQSDVVTGDHVWITAAIVGFIIGFILTSQIMEVVESGVTTLFVSFAIHPSVLSHTDPDLAVLFDETIDNW